MLRGADAPTNIKDRHDDYAATRRPVPLPLHLSPAPLRSETEPQAIRWPARFARLCFHQSKYRNTWKRQWFRTPGIRLLYIIPQSWTEQSIPLTLDPKPESLVRIMVIRAEVIPPELETADSAAVAALDSEPDRAKAYFHALGRFAEPRLRRALSLKPSTAGEQFVTTLSKSRPGTGVTAN